MVFLSLSCVCQILRCALNDGNGRLRGRTGDRWSPLRWWRGWSRCVVGIATGGETPPLRGARGCYNCSATQIVRFAIHDGNAVNSRNRRFQFTHNTCNSLSLCDMFANANATANAVGRKTTFCFGKSERFGFKALP